MFTRQLICKYLSQSSSICQQPLLHHLNIPKQVARRIHTSTRYQSSPRHRLKTTPLESEGIPHGPVPPSKICKALLFTGAFSTACFVGATVWEYESALYQMKENAKKTRIPWTRRPDEESPYFRRLKRELRSMWNSLSMGEKVFAPICAVNLIVFGLWKVPSLRNVLITYFSSNPAARVICWPMFLSTLSHYSMFHLFANMYVLHSFSTIAVQSLGKEQFLALYLSAGVVASFTSVVFRAVTSNVGLSIGASGAIMTILAYVCTQYPDTKLSILFFPMFTFSAGTTLKFIMGLDLAGVLCRWKFFDHAAHLGGAAFGVFWAYYGRDLWHKRVKFLSTYHDWRTSKH